MKKFIYLFIALAFVATSCSLNDQPIDTESQDVAFKTVADAANFANGMNTALRGLSSGSFIYDPDIATDYFNAGMDYGNREGGFHRWEWTASEDVSTSLWSTSYYDINEACYLLQGISTLSTTGLSDTEIASLKHYQGYAYFVKAYAGYMLLEYFCKPYTSANAASDLGIMLIDKYSSAVDPATAHLSYPGRSTLAASYDWVVSNLDKAYSCLSDVDGEVGSTTLTVDAVVAMQARVALAMQKWSLAAQKAASLVDAGTYPLAADYDEMNNIWAYDSGDECIVQMDASFNPSSLPASNDPGYVSYSVGSSKTAKAPRYAPDYIPEEWFIEAFANGDLRLLWIWLDYDKDAGNFVKPAVCKYNSATGKSYLLNKFPGNPDLRTPGTTWAYSNHVNKIKLFRIAEQYLIAAEAYAMMGSSTSACDYLSKYTQARIPGSAKVSLTGSALLSRIKTERTMEFVGEGFHFFDLKRWGDSMERTGAQNTSIISNAGSTTMEYLAKDPTDHRWLWPIPQAEIDANPQIKNQQNPGY
jgi:hypothetical protein